MRKLYATQTAVGTWAADATQRVEIDNGGLITELEMVWEVTPSATMAAANAPDGIWRLGRDFRVMGGSHTFFALPNDDGCMGGVLLHYMNNYDFRMAGVRGAVIVAPQRTYTPITFVLHCGARPRGMYGQANPFDLSGFIPGLDKTTLIVEAQNSGNDVMDDTVTISSATLRINRYYILGTHAEVMQEMMAQGVVLPTPGEMGVGDRITGMIPAWNPTIDSPTAVAADYGREINIPTDGAYLRRILLLAQDATANLPLRASDEATGIKVSVHGQDIVKVINDALTCRLPYANAEEDADAALDFGNHAGAGVFIVDLCQHRRSGGADAIYGLNLATVPSGAAKLGLTLTTNASGDDSLILYERYKPYFGPLGF